MIQRSCAHHSGGFPFVAQTDRGACAVCAPRASPTMQLEPAKWNFSPARIYQILTSANVRRLADLEKETWWQYLGATTRSPGYQAFLVRGLSETLVAANRPSPIPKWMATSCFSKCSRWSHPNQQ